LLGYVNFSEISPSVQAENRQVIAGSIIAIERPKKAPLPLTLLFASILFAQLVSLSHTHTSYGLRNLPEALGPAAALIGIFTILNMPLRDPTLSDEEISPVYSAPTVQLRTPEDNLTPLQYMTVSWMSPLIKKGMTKKMDDEDVWDLGWEFKHARLHDKFRTLEGSVTKRIFLANGMDCVYTTSLAVFRLCACKSDGSITVTDTIANPHSALNAGNAPESAGIHEGPGLPS
jgi:hypothetical protein